MYVSIVDCLFLYSLKGTGRRLSLFSKLFVSLHNHQSNSCPVGLNAPELSLSKKNKSLFYIIQSNCYLLLLSLSEQEVSPHADILCKLLTGFKETCGYRDYGPQPEKGGMLSPGRE